MAALAAHIGQMRAGIDLDLPPLPQDTDDRQARDEAVRLHLWNKNASKLYGSDGFLSVIIMTLADLLLG